MVMVMPASFWKKYGPMIPPDQNPHQIVTFSGLHLELVYLAWINIVPNSTILLVYISIHPKMGLIAKDDLLSEIWINFQLLQNPISDTALSMIVYLKFLGQLNFIGVQIQVPTQNSPSWNRRKVKFLWTTRNWPRLGFSRTLSRTAAMFSVDLTFRRRTGVGWLFIEPVDSNLATKRRIVDSAGWG